MTRTLILLVALLLPSAAWAQITAGSPATTQPVSGTVTVTDGAGALNVICDSGCSGGTTDADDASVATGQTTGLNIGLTHIYDGSVWRRLTIGTAGTASAQVLTVQGVTSMTPLLVDGSATTQPVSGTVTATATNLDVQIGGSDTVTVTDGAGAMNVIIDSGTTAVTATNLDVQIGGSDTVTVTATNLDIQSGGADVLSTTAHDAALGTAGTADAQVRSVQGIASMTPLLVQPQATTTGGATTLSYISAGSTEDEHAVCTTTCTLYSIGITNTNAAVRYLKCENDTAAGTAPGTDTPEFRMAVPGATTGAGFTHTFPVGAAFSTALTCWFVTGAADSDVAEVAANEIMAFYTFK